MPPSGRRVLGVVLLVLLFGWLALEGFFWLVDARSIALAKEVGSFIAAACRETGELPSKETVQAQFAEALTRRDWFFWDAKADLRGPDPTVIVLHPSRGPGQAPARTLIVQYPVNWWRNRAIGRVRLSEFTATPYAYAVEYQCQ